MKTAFKTQETVFQAVKSTVFILPLVVVCVGTYFAVLQVETPSLYTAGQISTSLLVLLSVILHTLHDHLSYY